MDLAGIKHVLDLDFARDDLKSEYAVYANRALRSIQQDNNWFCMRTKATITVPYGALSAPLPNDFKELTPGRTAIWMFAQDATSISAAKWLPCYVLREEELRRRDAILLLPRRLQILSRVGPDLYLTTDGTQFYFNMIDVLGAPSQFLVSYFRFLPDLADDTDRNYITDNYEEMIINKVKSVAFEAINDPVASNFEQAYELKLRKALNSDARRWLVGRKLQMGG